MPDPDSPSSAGEERTGSRDAAGRQVKPWSPLTFPQYRFLWTAGIFSVMGEQGRRAVDLYLVYQLSNGSALHLGLLGGAQAVPLFVVGLFGGTLVDIFDRKRLLQSAQTIRVALLVILAVLVSTDAVQIWHVYLITAVTAVAQVVEAPSRTSLIPATVPRQHLLNAMALNSSTRQAGMLAGPPLATFLIEPFGAGVSYSVQVGFYLASIATLSFISVRPVEARSLRGMRLADVTQGFTFVWRTRFVGAVIALDVLASIFTSWRVLMPIFAIDILGGDARTLGWLLAAPAVGRLVGTALMLLAGNARRQGLFVMSVTLGYAVSVALFALSTELWLSLLLLAFVGGTDGAGAIVRSTVVQLVVPEEIRGRVTSVFQIFAQGGPSIGQMATGALAAALASAPGALLFGAAFTAAAVAFVGVRVREVLRFRVTP